MEEKNLHIFWMTWWISVEFSLAFDNLKSHKKLGFCALCRNLCTFRVNIAASWRPATLLQRDYGSVVFLWILLFCDVFWKAIWVTFSQVPLSFFSGLDVKSCIEGKQFSNFIHVDYSITINFVHMEEEPGHLFGKI